MTLGRIWEHEIAYAVYGPFVNICGRNLFNPTEQTYLDLGFYTLPELEPLEGYHTAWRIALRPIPVPPKPEPEPAEEPTIEPEIVEDKADIIDDYFEEEPTEDEGEEVDPEPEPEPTPEPEPQYEEYIEAYYEEDPAPEDPEEKKRREEKQRRDYWYANFFQTSLGWVRKKATMKDGTVDDFLTQDLPLLAIGLGQGAEAKVIVYATPDFTQEIDILALQSYVDVTPQFIMECLLEKQNEFRSLTI